MAIEPYYYAREYEDRSVSEEAFLSALEADVNSLIALSESLSKERERSYVSSTSVAIAIGKLAPELRTSSFQFWGE